MYPILIVEDSAAVRETLTRVLADEGFPVSAVGSAEEALRLLKQMEFSLILSDMKLPGKSGLELQAELQQLQIETPTILLTAYGSIDTAVTAMKSGAREFLTKPFDPEQLLSKIRAILIPQPESPEAKSREFLSQSPKVRELLHQARRVAPLSSTVLIVGESGTGKELLAHLIHELSPRQSREFIALNCGSIPAELLESELFGHEAGAFTGANERRIGLFEAANNGTIFLDEIGNMPAALQMKLLRTLQENEIRRVGGTKNVRIDTRVISATNTDIEAEIKKGTFREDLYYRLGVVILSIPPLRERPEDIVFLAEHFIRVYSAQFQKEPLPLTSSAARFLERHNWPGNVRELENAVQRALIFSDGALTPQSFELRSIEDGDDFFARASTAQTPGASSRSLHELSAEASKRAEVKALLEVLAHTKGNKLRAAKLLGVSYKTLLNKVRDYELESDIPKRSELS